MDPLGANLTLLLAPRSNPVHWEGWMSSLGGPRPHAAAQQHPLAGVAEPAR